MNTLVPIAVTLFVARMTRHASTPPPLPQFNGFTGKPVVAGGKPL